MIVVGSGNSSNSVRLVEVALEAGAKASYRVDDASEIDEAWLDGVSDRRRDLRRLGARGAGRRRARASSPSAATPTPRPCTRAEESLIFALPPELRRDLKAAGQALTRQRAVARYLDVHPDNPQPRLIAQVVEALRDDALIAYPTDSGYALGCRLGNRDGRDRILRIRDLDDKHHFTLVCTRLRPARAVRARRQLGVPGHQGGHARALHVHPAGDTGEVPRRLMHPKKRTVGVRIPDHVVVCAILEALGEPLLSSTLILPGGRPSRGPWAGRSRRSSTTRSTS